MDKVVVDMVFLIVTGLIERKTKYSGQAMLITVYTMCLHLIDYLMFKPCDVIGSGMSSYNLEKKWEIRSNWRESVQKFGTNELALLKVLYARSCCRRWTRSGLHNFFETFLSKNFDLLKVIVIKTKSLKNNSTVVERMKALNNFCFSQSNLRTSIQVRSKDSFS